VLCLAADARGGLRAPACSAVARSSPLCRPRLRVVEHQRASRNRHEIRRPRQRRRTQRLEWRRFPGQIPDGRCKARWVAAQRLPGRIPESSANLLPGLRLSTGCEFVARSYCIGGYRHEGPTELARYLLPPWSSPGSYAGEPRGRFRWRWSQRSIRRRHRVGALEWCPARRRPRRCSPAWWRRQ
jgi:hypothetical protein